MTTKFLDNTFFKFKFVLSWRFPRKRAFWDDFPLCPPLRPLKNRKLYFYCLRRAKSGWMLNGGVSQFVPKCPVLASFVPICPLSRPQKGQKRTNGDKTGQIGTNWETPPFRIHHHLALLKLSSRRLSEDFSLLVVFLLVTFSRLFRGPLLSRKTVFGPFSLLFCGFFVAPVLGKFYAYSP